MKEKRAHQIQRIINGVLQLCRGQGGGIVWVDQLDAAAFSDGENIYLPRPTGEHEGELDLLLALALREVARTKHSDASCFASADTAGVMASVVEDARVKKAIGSEYRGAPQVFQQAYRLGESLLEQSTEEMSADAMKHRLVYLAANDALHGSDYRHKLGADYFKAVTGLPEEVRSEVMTMARRAGDTASTGEAVALARQILERLAQQESVAQPQGEADQQAQDQEQKQGGQPQGEADQQDQDQEQQQGGQPQGEADQQDQDQDQEQQQGGQPQGEADQQDQEQEQQQGGQPQGEAGQQAQDQEQQQGGQPQGEAGQQAQDQEQRQGGQPQGEADQQAQDQEQQQGGQPQGEADQQAQDQEQQQGGQPQEEDSFGNDYLSNALAKLRGFNKATRVAVQEKATEPKDALESRELEVLEALLEGRMDADEALSGFLHDSDHGGDEGVCMQLQDLDPGAHAGSAYLDEELNDGSHRLPPVPARLVSVLLLGLQDRRKRPSRLAFSGPRIDASRTWRIKAIGDSKVFRKKEKVPGIDAGVSILLDRSGSMEEDMEQAASIAYSMAVALQRVNGVKTSIDVFPGLCCPASEMLAFKQSPPLIKADLEAVTAGGGTPTAEALALRLQKLLELRCEKRVVFVITDGIPDDPSQLDATVRRASSEDVMVVGVGIGSRSSVGSHFPVSVTVGSVEELPRALEFLFRETLTDRLAA